MTELPSTVTSLINRLAPGWAHRVIVGTGHHAVSYYGASRSDGTRPTLTRWDPCTSLSLRLRHDDGRAAVGVWLRPDGKGWTFKSAWRWQVCTDQACPHAGTDHPDALPDRADSDTLAAWLTVPSAAAFTAAAAGITARKAASSAKAAATRAARRSTDISTSATTEAAA